MYSPVLGTRPFFGSIVSSQLRKSECSSIVIRATVVLNWRRLCAKRARGGGVTANGKALCHQSTFWVFWPIAQPSVSFEVLNIQPERRFPPFQRPDSIGKKSWWKSWQKSWQKSNLKRRDASTTDVFRSLDFFIVTFWLEFSQDFIQDFRQNWFPIESDP